MTDVEWIEGIRVPLPETLRSHGHTHSTWLEIAIRQDFRCAICGKKPDSGILHIDHQHVRGYKKMPSERRRQYTRGLVCQFDNRFVLARTITVKKARTILDYLLTYEARRVE